MSLAPGNHGSLFTLDVKAWLFAKAVKHRYLYGFPRVSPAKPQRILIAHQLLLGDALMLTPLIAKLHQSYPNADITVAMPWAQVPLYASRPYGIHVWPFDAKAHESLEPLLIKAETQGGFDLAIIPGENRYAWFAAACGARWIVALAGGSRYKNGMTDELKPWPNKIESLADIFSSLSHGESPAKFARVDWPAPSCEKFALPENKYVVLHVGASNPNKLWPAGHWRNLASALSEKGLTVVWSAGRNETELVDACDPSRQFPSTAGKLNLAQMWHLLEGATMVVAPDTGIAHLARVIGTPTVAIFGPGLTKLYAGCGFWANSPFKAVVLEELPSRFQATLFKRKLAWLNDHDSARLPDAVYGNGYETVRDTAFQMLKP